MHGEGARRGGPVTIDTKLLASDGAAGDRFGETVSGAGDVNDDGYADVIVGAGFNSDRGRYSGSAYVYLGGDGGVDTSTELKLIPSDSGRRDHFGASVSGAGDVNADGYDDVIVGAYGDTRFTPGTAYVYHGGAGGIDPTAETILAASDGTISDYFAQAVSGAGDVNADGYDDVIVGAYKDGDRGSAYVFLGSASGIDSSAETRLTASDDASGEWFGVSVSGAGDVNGDGYHDVIVGDAQDDAAQGAAYVFLGGPGGVDPATEVKLVPSDGAANDAYGTSVSGAGDVNADGYDDVIVGSYLDDDEDFFPFSVGSAYVYLGGPTGIDAATEIKIAASDGASSDFFGIAVSDAGDYDGDGYGDVVVGAFGDGSSTGALYVYLGGPGGTDPAAETKLVAFDGATDDDLGSVVSGAGDVDGDGLDDVIGGAYAQDGLRGAAYLPVAPPTPSGGGTLLGTEVSLFAFSDSCGVVGATVADPEVEYEGLGPELCFAGDIARLDSDVTADRWRIDFLLEQDFGCGGGPTDWFTLRDLNPVCGDGSTSTVAGVGAVTTNMETDEWVGTQVVFADHQVVVQCDATALGGDDPEHVRTHPGDFIELEILFDCGDGPEAVLSGSCPGEVTAELAGFTPGGGIGVLVGDGSGSDALAGGPCAGAVTELTGPSLVATANADATGAQSLSLDLAGFACGRSLQMLDLASCVLSPARYIP